MKSHYAKWSTIIVLSAALPWVYLIGDAFKVGDKFVVGGADASHGKPSKPEVLPDAMMVSTNQRAKAIVFAGKDGAFHAETLVNGGPISMIVDTGATLVVLRKEDAQKLGITPTASEFKRELQTANGKIFGADVVLREVVIGGIIEKNVEAVVIPDKLSSSSLLGRSFTSRLKIEAAGDRMLLSK